MCVSWCFIPLVNRGVIKGLILPGEATIQLGCFIVFSQPPLPHFVFYARCLFSTALCVELSFMTSLKPLVPLGISFHFISFQMFEEGSPTAMLIFKGPST